MFYFIIIIYSCIIYILINIDNIDIKYRPNFGVFTYCQYYINIVKNIPPFNCHYFQYKTNISGILSLHCKYFRCEANVSVIVAFHRKYSYCKYCTVNQYQYFIVFAINATVVQYWASI